MVSPRFDRNMKGIRRRRGEFRTSDLNDAFLVIAATDQPKLNARIKRLCDRRNILVNVVDRPDLCSFYAPSILRRGPLMLAISTDIDRTTIETFRRQIMDKLKLRIVAELTKYAVREGLTSHDR